MTVTYTNAVKDARLAAVITAIGAAGKLEIGTAGMASVLATFTLDNPAGAASNGVLTLAFVSATVTAAATGAAAAARIRTSGDVDIVTGLTVSESAGDIIIDNASINSGQDVIANSATITSP